MQFFFLRTTEQEYESEHTKNIIPEVGIPGVANFKKKNEKPDDMKT